MFKKLSSLLIVSSVFLLTACDYVPLGYNAKIVSAGTSVETAPVKESGKYFLWGTESFVFMEKSTQIFTEQIKTKIADDQDLTFSVNVRMMINETPENIQFLYTHTPIQTIKLPDSGDSQVITLESIYNIHARNEIKNIARSIISKYKTEDIPKNFDKIQNAFSTEIVKRMENSPVSISSVTLDSLVYPETYTTSVEKRNQRELALQIEKNQQAIELAKRTNELELAKKDREINKEKAESIREQNEITSKGLSPALLQYRALEVQEKMASNQNTIFVPYEALTSSGLQNRIYDNK